MFAYCNNNPASYEDNAGRFPWRSTIAIKDGGGSGKEDENNESDGSYRFLGVGFQGEFSVGYYEMGLEIIVYTDTLVCGGENYKVAIYSYEGAFANINSLKKSDTYTHIIEKLTLAIATNAVDEANAQALLIALQTALFKDVGVSGSVLALFGNNEFQTTSAYNGPFDTYSATIKHVKISYSTSSSCKVIAIGGSSDRWDISFGQSYYTQLN